MYTRPSNQVKRAVWSGPDYTLNLRWLDHHLPYLERPVRIGPYHMVGHVVGHVTSHDLFVDWSTMSVHWCNGLPLCDPHTWRTEVARFGAEDSHIERSPGRGRNIDWSGWIGKQLHLTLARDYCWQKSTDGSWWTAEQMCKRWAKFIMCSHWRCLVEYVSSCFALDLLSGCYLILSMCCMPLTWGPEADCFCTVPLADSAWGLWFYIRFDGLMCFSPCGLMDSYYWMIAVASQSTAELEPC